MRIRRPFMLGLFSALAALLGAVGMGGPPPPFTVVDDNTGGDVPVPTSPGGFSAEREGEEFAWYLSR